MPRLVISLAIGALAASYAPAADAQQPAPPAAYSVGSAFDAVRGKLVIFGGYVNGSYAGNTWEHDGHAWTLVTSDGPSARNSPALVYDDARHQVVLFGGDTRATGVLGDTWVYDGARWRRVATSGPPPRTTHQMVYDARRKRVVLFGGIAGQEMLGDTWEWDGQRWAQVATTGPEARTLYGLAYDSVRGRTVLFGGTSKLAPDAPSWADTWEWDGAAWTKTTATGPSPRDHVAMGYDPVRRAVVLHGGGLGPVDPGETWAYDGKAWTRITATGPRRRYARLEFDTRAKSMLLFGGFDREPSNELWRLEATSWERVSSPP
ncbi:MAG TPA: kelch repeat-containing protein [Gemmatimonadaceae bacterium]|nr:kelch repeat-containing protein [Gemmatimonadaceae bacterium]